MCDSEKKGSKYGMQKIGLKKQVQDFFVVIQKEKRQPGLFSFKLQIASRNNMVQNMKKISGQPEKLDIRMQIDGAFFWSLMQ